MGGAGPWPGEVSLLHPAPEEAGRRRTFGVFLPGLEPWLLAEVTSVSRPWVAEVRFVVVACGAVEMELRLAAPTAERLVRRPSCWLELGYAACGYRWGRASWDRRGSGARCVFQVPSAQTGPWQVLKLRSGWGCWRHPMWTQ